MIQTDMDWDDFLLPYDQAVEEMALKFTLLRDEYIKRGEYSPIHYISKRLKSVNSIMEKMHTKNITFDEIAYKMADIAGIRLVTQFEEDIELLAKLIATRSDMKIIERKDYFKNPKPSGYKSVHLIVEYDVNTIRGVESIIAEIQLRTLAMDFWATIEHSLNYKYRDEMPGELKERLVIAAKTVHELDREMGTIRDEIADAQRLFTRKTEIIDAILENLNTLGKQGKREAVKRYFKNFTEFKDSDNTLQLVLMSKEIERELEEGSVEL
ncbi:MAG: GTP pyrophosphokinase family protein [Eubacteriaceae bacterium]|nr:GTP pyrophosphokinase family protein [Eubacteriaceae bacterium]